MPFNMLIATCLLGDTCYNENKVKVYFERDSKDEKVLFFKIDDNHTENCVLKPGFRNYCYNTEQESNKCSKKITRHKKVSHLEADSSQKSNKVCDLLIYYSKGDTLEEIMCLTELKSDENDIDHALLQIMNTYNKFKDKVSSDYNSKYPKNTTWMGCVCCKRGSAPSYHDQQAIYDFINTSEYRNCKLNIEVFPVHYVSEYEPFYSCDIGKLLRQKFNHSLKQKNK
ncbi:hypothetical protein [Methanosarcina sp. UBA289]|uniref:hypothetical protein n=1 Tax=Methanosarcina sp. UBA289 TaxID=1915574 RepID=UPI00260043DA|nr:hypothetical protein [Methanosarcina sp. UBA289]